MKKKIRVALLAIVFLAAVLRFWQIGSYPAGFNADEASYGYNAYSLMLTGKDEHGESWPIHLKSFADYKPAGTAYLAIPFIKFFGLRETSVRLPSLLAGVASVFIIFFLVQELFSSYYGVTNSGYLLSLLSSLFLAVSPWHIHFSRGAWETNLATTFMLLGLWLFFKGLKNPRYFPLSIINFTFSMYTYHTPRVVIPLLGVFLVIFFRKHLFKHLKWMVVCALMGIILIAPLILSFLGPAGSARFSGVSVFADVGPVWRVNRLRGEHAEMTSFSAKILHNKPIIYALRIAENWLAHFDGKFLFVLGDGIKRSNSPDMGEMYLFDSLFILVGIYYLMKFRPKNYLFVSFWLLVAPVAASLTFQAPNALRAHNMVIPLTILSAFGLYHLLNIIKNSLSSSSVVACLPAKALATAGYFLLVSFILWNASYFLHQYFVHYPKTYPEAWEYGIKDLVNYLLPIRNNYEKVYVTEKYDQPYIIFLFYMKYPPENFQKEVVLTPRDKFGFSTVRDLDNFHFENINWEDFRDKGNILICGTDEEIPEETENVNIVKEIYFRNSEPAFQCAEI